MSGGALNYLNMLLLELICQARTAAAAELLLNVRRFHICDCKQQEVTHSFWTVYKDAFFLFFCSLWVEVSDIYLCLAFFSNNI